MYILCAVKTQGYGRRNKKEWTKKYALNISINNIEWTEYTEEGEKKVSYFTFISIKGCEFQFEVLIRTLVDRN